MFDWFTGKIAYLSTWIGFKIGCNIARMFPRPLYRLSDWLARVAFFLFRKFRNRSRDNIRAALGADLDGLVIDDIARSCLRNFFRACVEIGVAIKSSAQELRAGIAVIGRENIDAALAKGKGVVILSAHLGNFFLIGSRLAIEGIPTFVLVNQPRDGRFAKLMDEYRLQVQQKTIHARPRHLALRELNEVLRGNQAVLIIADEYRKGGGIEVSLFGIPVIARRGPVTVALRTGAAIVPACMVRQSDNSLRLIIEPELELERTARGKTQIRENTIRITRWLERTVRAYPDQWNWTNINRWGMRKNHPVSASEPAQRAYQ
jgi:Kdo2-lipid IVA lauroyltransferase/acyltransferase